jgi:hypothetical protein
MQVCLYSTCFTATTRSEFCVPNGVFDNDHDLEGNALVVKVHRPFISSYVLAV